MRECFEVVIKVETESAQVELRTGWEVGVVATSDELLHPNGGASNVPGDSTRELGERVLGPRESNATRFFV